MSHIELGMGAITAACLLWAGIHHYLADRRAGADAVQGEPCADE